MPYIYADRWADICLEPMAGENYSTFANRVVPGLMLLKPNATIEECHEKAKEAWAAFVLREATEVTVTLSREWSVYQDSEWMDGYLGDWEVKEVLGGTLSNVGIVYYDADIATAGSGAIAKNRTKIAKMDFGGQPLVVDIEEATKRNENFRTTLWTGKDLQVTLMCLQPGESIGAEQHDNLEQFLRIEEGEGTVKMGDDPENPTLELPIYEGYAIVVPVGKWHNITNTGKEPLKLYSIYAPPEHPFNSVHATKAEYLAAEQQIHGAGDEVFKIAKSKEDEQLVFGWANIAIDAEGQFPLDWDGDVTSPEHLEKAAYNFVLKYRATGEQHEGEIKGDLVESVMFTKEKQQAMGIPEGVVPEGWWVGFHIPDAEVFAKIKSGEYKMFSVEGTAKRLPLQD